MWCLFLAQPVAEVHMAYIYRPHSIAFCQSHKDMRRSRKLASKHLARARDRSNQHAPHLSGANLLKSLVISSSIHDQNKFLDVEVC